jgi:hypothetical protein
VKDNDDNSTCIQLVLFGTDAEQVVGSTIDSLLPGPHSDWLIIPERLNDVVKRKTIEARVSVASRSFDDGIIRFQVNRLLAVVATDSDIPRQGKKTVTYIPKKKAYLLTIRKTRSSSKSVTSAGGNQDIRNTTTDASFETPTDQEVHVSRR